MTRLFVTILCLLSIAIANAEDIHGVVTRVHDGDTYFMRADDGSEIKVRQQTIDAPEISQRHGDVSADFNFFLLCGREVILHKTKNDLYGRTLGRTSVKIGDKWYDVERILLTYGWAWHYQQYDHNQELDAIEDVARANRRGLWIDSNPIPPWQYRREKKNK